jgi:hypothetical protein
MVPLYVAFMATDLLVAAPVAAGEVALAEGAFGAVVENPAGHFVVVTFLTAVPL